MAAAELAPVPLLAVLKHPLCAGGWDRGRWVTAARRLERAALRGAAPGAGARRAARGRARRPVRPRPGRRALAEVMALLDRLEEALGGFTALPGSPDRPPAELLAAHLAAAEALAATAIQPGGLRLYAGEEGEALAAHLAALEPAMAALPPLLARRLAGAVRRRDGRRRRPQPARQPRAATAARIRGSRSSACWKPGC